MAMCSVVGAAQRRPICWCCQKFWTTPNRRLYGCIEWRLLCRIGRRGRRRNGRLGHGCRDHSGRKLAECYRAAIREKRRSRRPEKLCWNGRGTDKFPVSRQGLPAGFRPDDLELQIRRTRIVRVAEVEFPAGGVV